MIEELEVDDSPDVMISLRDLRVSYGEREILHGVSFEVMRGETMVILGGSGSGKSTLLRTLVGLEKTSSGEVILRGKNIATASAEDMDEIRKKLGMSFQGSALFGSMTVGENVAIPLCVHTNLEDSAMEILVAEVLFFHEPSAGLDPIIAAGIDQLILELKRAFKMTIIVVTHELASAFLIADRMVLIDKGNVEAIGPVEEMRKSTQPRLRQFLDRVPEPEVAREMDYLQMLTKQSGHSRGATGKRSA